MRVEREGRDMPSLETLLRSNLGERMSWVTYGFPRTGEQAAEFQITTAARLLDKTLRSWDLAKRELLAGDGIGRVPVPSVYRAVDHLEDVVITLDRLVRVCEPLRALPEAADQRPFPSRRARRRLSVLRNRIAHGDDDIVSHASRGLPTATMRLDASGVELQGVRIRFVELGDWISASYVLIRTVLSRRDS